MCCWARNSLLIEHRYETGEDVMYQGEKTVVTQVFPVEVGNAEYNVFVAGRNIRVLERDLSPIEVKVDELVTR